MGATVSTDRAILRDLARQYAEVASDPVQDLRRDLWRHHNSLKGDRPLVYIRAFAWAEMPESSLACEDPFFRPYEDFLRYQLYWASLGDDSIFEPWVTVRAVYQCEGWGVEGEKRYVDGAEPSPLSGSYKVDYPLKTLADVERLRLPFHGIDEEATAERVERLQDAIGDLIEVNVDRAPYYRMWEGDIAQALGNLRGIEHFMLDMVDDPAGLHRLVRFLSDGVLRSHVRGEAAGDWNLSAHANQAMPYAEELPDPKANASGVPQRQLWGFAASQEFTGVSPAMHEEFLLRYQLPILARFGLSAYGCCEDLTRKIGMLRQIPNLRRIAVSPMADVAACAEQIGEDYVLSYRPSPSEMVGYSFDPARVRAILREAFAACRGCHFDVTLKDVETVGRDPTRVREWLRIARDEIERL